MVRPRSQSFSHTPAISHMPHKTGQPRSPGTVTGSSILSRSNDQVPVETRLQLVLAVLAHEMTVAEAARRHGVSAESINRWRDRFVDAGKATMKDGIRARPAAAEAWSSGNAPRSNAAPGLPRHVTQRPAEARSPRRGTGRRQVDVARPDDRPGLKINRDLSEVGRGSFSGERTPGHRSPEKSTSRAVPCLSARPTHSRTNCSALDSGLPASTSPSAEMEARLPAW
jgi:transposase-like protein